MKDPFCKNEPLDPEIEKMVRRLKRANDLDIPAWGSPLSSRNTPVWERKAVIASKIHLPEPCTKRIGLLGGEGCAYKGPRPRKRTKIMNARICKCFVTPAETQFRRSLLQR